MTQAYFARWINGDTTVSKLSYRNIDPNEKRKTSTQAHNKNQMDRNSVCKWKLGPKLLIAVVWHIHFACRLVVSFACMIFIEFFFCLRFECFECCSHFWSHPHRLTVSMRCFFLSLNVVVFFWKMFVVFWMFQLQKKSYQILFVDFIIRISIKVVWKFFFSKKNFVSIKINKLKFGITFLKVFSFFRYFCMDFFLLFNILSQVFLYNL